MAPQTENTAPRIVVGTDGSPPAAEAVRWAHREAEARGQALVAVLAWDLLDHGPAAIRADFDQEQADGMLDWSLSDALGEEAAKAVERRAPREAAPTALLEEAGEGDLLVVGSRGYGGFKGLLMGSVSEKVVHQASGTVVVVPRDRPQANGRIVVGVDGSDHSVRALAWAFEEARHWGGRVEAVTAWSYPAEAMPFGPLGGFAELEEGANAALERSISLASSDDAERRAVERTVVSATPAAALLERAEDAAMLVVGSRGRGTLKSLVLGSVSSQCLRHAPCPTVVVR